MMAPILCSKALRDNTDGAQDTFCSELIRIMEKYPWCDGVDIDLEKGDDYSTHAVSTAMFQHIYETVKGYDPSKEMNICLPGMTRSTARLVARTGVFMAT